MEEVATVGRGRTVTLGQVHDVLSTEVGPSFADDVQKMLLPASEAQRELSDPGEKKLGPFQRHSSTSRKAALEALPRQDTQRWAVLCTIFSAPKTRDEIASAIQLTPNAVRPRVVELITGGWVVELEGMTRKTPAGKGAAVLAVTTRGRERLDAAGVEIAG